MRERGFGRVSLQCSAQSIILMLPLPVLRLLKVENADGEPELVFVDRQLTKSKWTLVSYRVLNNLQPVDWKQCNRQCVGFSEKRYFPNLTTR